MNTILIILGLFLNVMGLAAIVSPAGFRSMVQFSTARPGLYIAAGIRLLMGTLLFWGASGSRAPGLIFLVGSLLLASGIIMPALSPVRLEKISGWWAGQSDGTVRLWGIFSASVGAGIIWAGF